MPNIFSHVEGFSASLPEVPTCQEDVSYNTEPFVHNMTASKMYKAVPVLYRVSFRKLEFRRQALLLKKSIYQL